MNRIRIMDEFYDPRLQTNLLLACNILSNGLKVYFHINECIAGGASGNVVAIARHEGKFYQMTFTEACSANVANFVILHTGGGLDQVWHCEFGHKDVKSIYAIQSMVRDMNLSKTSCPTSTLVCQICIESKQCAVNWAMMWRYKQQNLWRLCIWMFVASWGTCMWEGGVFCYFRY